MCMKGEDTKWNRLQEDNLGEEERRSAGEDGASDGRYTDGSVQKRGGRREVAEAPREAGGSGKNTSLKHERGGEEGKRDRLVGGWPPVGRGQFLVCAGRLQASISY